MTLAWWNEQQRLTPDDVQAVSFPTSKLGRRGLEEEPVRAFVGEVYSEIVRLWNERTSLFQEVQRLRRRILGQETANDAVLFGSDDAHVHAVRILSSAQLTADRYVRDAQAYSGRLTAEARARRDEITSQAQQHAALVLQEAHGRAREAAVSALNTVMPSTSAGEWKAAQAELAYLRTFSDVYRTHLRAYTEGVLRSIEDWERKEAASVEQVTDRAGLGGQRPQ
jgi:DivIVA domain-containing protein